MTLHLQLTQQPTASRRRRSRNAVRTRTLASSRLALKLSAFNLTLRGKSDSFLIPRESEPRLLSTAARLGAESILGTGHFLVEQPAICRFCWCVAFLSHAARRPTAGDNRSHAPLGRVAACCAARPPRCHESRSLEASNPAPTSRRLVRVDLVALAVAAASPEWVIHISGLLSAPDAAPLCPGQSPLARHLHVWLTGVRVHSE